MHSSLVLTALISAPLAFLPLTASRCPPSHVVAVQMKQTPLPVSSGGWTHVRVDSLRGRVSHSRRAVHLDIEGWLWNHTNPKGELNQLWVQLGNSRLVALVQETVHPGPMPGVPFDWHGEIELHLPPGESSVELRLVLTASLDDHCSKDHVEVQGGGWSEVLGTVHTR